MTRNNYLNLRLTIQYWNVVPSFIKVECHQWAMLYETIWIDNINWIHWTGHINHICAYQFEFDLLDTHRCHRTFIIVLLLLLLQRTEKELLGRGEYKHMIIVWGNFNYIIDWFRVHNIQFITRMEYFEVTHFLFLILPNRLISIQIYLLNWTFGPNCTHKHKHKNIEKEKERKKSTNTFYIYTQVAYVSTYHLINLLLWHCIEFSMFSICNNNPNINSIYGVCVCVRCLFHNSACYYCTPIHSNVSKCYSHWCAFLKVQK